MKQLLILSLLLFSQFGFSQFMEMVPSSTKLLDLSIEGEKAFNENLEAAKKIWDKMENGIKYEDLSQREKAALAKVDELMTNYWDIIGGGCSWYCAGGPKKITASSFLQSQGGNNYEPKNALDLNYKNAWVEGVDGYGINEYLLYTFDGSAPRITEIIVVNGYVKSKSAWENNSRVKTLKVYIDEKPYAILHLEDIRGEQIFKVEPIGNGNRRNRELLESMPDWTLKFEIADVYKGLKYDDVVISEIYFWGLDVHCFAKGTKVQMADHSTQNIEELKIGDLVSFFDFDTRSIKSTTVKKLEKVVHHGLVKYNFKSGIEIIATQDHPFYLDKKGWASLLPDKTRHYEGFYNVNKIQIGDSFVTQSEVEILSSIEFLEGKQETYTISKLGSGNNFIANGFIVGVEELKDR